MKKIMFIILLIITALLIISCPQNVVKGTVWEGTLTGDFGSGTKDYDIEAYFKPDNTMKAYLTINSSTQTAEGTYVIGNNYAITTPDKLTGSGFTVDLEGVLNYYTGQGSGDYVLDNGTEFKGEWTLSKVGSY